jgi:hypothetical protein
MRMQAQSVIDYSGHGNNASGHILFGDEHMTPGAKLLGSAKKKNQSLLREAGAGGIPGFSLNQNSKHDALNYDSIVKGS